jgi:hypothetical protein
LRLFLFLLLFLFFRSLRLRRRRSRPRRRWRGMFLGMSGWRRSCWPLRRLIPVWFRSIRLCRRGTVRGRSGRATCLRTVVCRRRCRARRRLSRTIHFRVCVRLRWRGTIRRWSRLIGRPIRWSWSRGRGRTAGSRRLSWTCRLSWLSWPRRIRRRMSRVRSRGFRRWRNSYGGMCRGRRGKFRHFTSGQRLARMSGQRLLLFREWHRRRRRSSFRNYCAIRHCRRRCRHVTSRRSLSSQNTRWSGSHRNPRRDRSGSDLSRIHRNCCFGHRLRAHKCLLRNRSHRSLHPAVRIRHIRDRRRVVDDRGAINRRDLRDVHRRIAHVHLRHIRLTHVVGRHENLARS